MPKLTLALKNGQLARVRRSRLYYPKMEVGSWKNENLFVHEFNGTLVIVSVDGFAEFDPRNDYEGEENGIHKFVAEDYVLEIDEASLSNE